ncbi:hypothetical protein [Kitasatospora sp. MBT63]|uniref:hypothetical protein n=1 Tax=Kitasatospora sp. MBT63 TaxID=1444768 RepID=UPI00053A9188|nr:hypothetical protein [Kitasatospora sp. MBT63]
MRLPLSRRGPPVMDTVRRRAAERGVGPTATVREWIEAAVADESAVVPLSVITAAVAEYRHRRAS